MAQIATEFRRFRDDSRKHPRYGSIRGIALPVDGGWTAQ